MSTQHDFDAICMALHGRVSIDDALESVGRLRQRIATLEAEKAERERQEPVAWAWNDSLGCMHVHCGSRRPYWVDDECSDSMRSELSLRPLYAHPLAMREPSEEECRDIADAFLCNVATASRSVRTGRAMWRAVKEVML